MKTPYWAKLYNEVVRILTRGLPPSVYITDLTLSGLRHRCHYPCLHPEENLEKKACSLLKLTMIHNSARTHHRGRCPKLLRLDPDCGHADLLSSGDLTSYHMIRKRSPAVVSL